MKKRGKLTLISLLFALMLISPVAWGDELPETSFYWPKWFGGWVEVVFDWAQNREPFWQVTGSDATEIHLESLSEVAAETPDESVEVPTSSNHPPLTPETPSNEFGGNWEPDG